MDAETVDLHDQLWPGIQAGLGRPPVVAVRRVPEEPLQGSQRDTLRPVVDRLGVGPARAPQALAEVIEVGFGDL